MSYRTLSEWCQNLSGMPQDLNSEVLSGMPLGQSGPQTDRDFHEPSRIELGSFQEDGDLHLSEKTSVQTSSLVQQSVDALINCFNSRLLQSVSLPSMGCEFEILLNEHQYPCGVECAVEGLNIVKQVENLFSVYRPQSQLSKVNQFAAQRPVLLDVKTLELVQLALDVNEWTLGAFDITAGSLSEAWGFARREGSMPSQELIQKALELAGSQWIHLDCEENTISLGRADVKLNPGGIGKGYALDYAARHLTSCGIEDFVMHGGLSSIIARGSKQGSLDHDWKVALKHPWRSNETVEILSLKDQCLGTSGSGKQFFHFGGKRYSHIIDPRTGWPADQMMSATVICRSSAVADALATGLFVMGPRGAIEFCEAHPQISGIFIFTDPKSGKQSIERRNCTNCD